MKTDRRGARKINDGAVAERVPKRRRRRQGAGAGTLSRNAGTPSESDAGGVGAGTLSTDGTPPYLTQFFFHCAAKTLESNFITFCPKRKVLLDLGGSK